VTTKTRSPLIPDPHAGGVGFAGYRSDVVRAVGYQGTPKEAFDRMYAETVKAMQQPDMKRIWDAQGQRSAWAPPRSSPSSCTLKSRNGARW
jgi:tripartite-type tricarboxylate transporter receptor subunit TctC